MATVLVTIGAGGGAYASERPWEGAELAARVQTLRTIVPLTDARELLRFCDARLIGDGAYAGPGATIENVAITRRLAKLFREPAGLSFVLIPELAGQRTAGFEGVAFDRRDRVTANFAIAPTRALGEFEVAIDRTLRRVRRANDRDGLVLKLLDRAGVISKRCARRRPRHHRVIMDDVVREFAVVSEKLARESRVFVEDPPRPLRLIIACAESDEPADPNAARFRAYLKILTTRGEDLRFVVLEPERVRVILGGHVLDERGRPAEF